MFRTFFWYVLGWAYLIITLPVLLRVKYLEKHNRNNKKDYLAYKFTRGFAKFLFYLTGSTIKISGKENIPKSGAVLFVSNHQSHIDNVIIHGFVDVPKGFISIVEVKKIPILSTWMKYMKCVFMDRSDLRQTLICINQGIEFLKQGHSMVIYPEGKLSEGQTVGEFKNGCLKLAIKAGVPIVPIIIRSSYKVMTKDGSRIKSAEVECIISKPVPTNTIKKDDEKELVNMIRDIIIENISSTI